MNPEIESIITKIEEAEKRGMHYRSIFMSASMRDRLSEEHMRIVGIDPDTRVKLDTALGLNIRIAETDAPYLGTTELDY